MTVASRITEVRIKIAILIVSILISFSLTAQETTSSDYSQILRKDAFTAIRLAPGVNPKAEAKPLMHEVNSPYDDIRPRLAPSGDRLYFSRNFHPGNFNQVNDPEDIWYSDFDSTTDAWSEPKHMKGVLNNAGPNYVNNVSRSGDTLILGNQYLKKGKMRAGLSYSVNVNGEWSVPVAINIFNDYNLSPHSNSFVALSLGVIIRTVEREESIGERDLFVSFWDGNIATEPVNMGSVINTEAEESSPFLSTDNKTLYFASKGHAGYGGYDIYVTHRLDDTWTNWSAPQNLGPAVNGQMDDEFFSVSGCGTIATFSKQVNVHNNDLFRISMDTLFGNPGNDNASKTELESVAKL